jgi:hypothetical protein
MGAQKSEGKSHLRSGMARLQLIHLTVNLIHQPMDAP